jgi:hypothetical protein
MPHLTRPRLQRLATPLGWPGAAPWLDAHNSTDLERRVAWRALQDVGLVEEPLGSNRGRRLDAMARRGGSPLGSYWCALWVGEVLADCGLGVPPGYGSCDAWRPWATPGLPETAVAVVLYGTATDYQHIGLQVRRTPVRLTVEGNRGLRGSGTRNGVAVDLDAITRADAIAHVALPQLVLAA